MTIEVDKSCLFSQARRDSEGIFTFYVTGRKYNPSNRRAGEPSPQSDPALFTDSEILTEVRYLMKLNRNYGANDLRTARYLTLLSVLQYRKGAK